MMLKISFEFRKGIFFVRLIGNLNKETYKCIEKDLNELIDSNKFKYIVINTNYLNSIDMIGLNYLAKLYYITIKNQGNMIICDKSKCLKTILNNNVPNIENEFEVL